MRIKRIVELIKPNSIVVDVGSDHANLACLLLLKDIAKFVYNIEINSLPLKNGISNLTKHNVLPRTKNLLNNGLKDLQINRKIDYCVIAGMGGKNIINIISNKNKDLKISNFILVPNNNACALRKWLMINKYKISYEEIIKENKHYYELIIVSKKGIKISSEIDQYFGPYNLKNPNNVFIDYINSKHQYFLKNKKVLINKIKKQEFELLSNYVKKISR